MFWIYSRICTQLFNRRPYALHACMFQEGNINNNLLRNSPSNNTNMNQLLQKCITHSPQPTAFWQGSPMSATISFSFSHWGSWFMMTRAFWRLTLIFNKCSHKPVQRKSYHISQLKHSLQQHLVFSVTLLVDAVHTIRVPISNLHKHSSSAKQILQSKCIKRPNSCKTDLRSCEVTAFALSRSSVTGSGTIPAAQNNKIQLQH